MTVKGVNSTAGIPVAASQNLNVQNSAQPAAAVSVGTMQPLAYEEPKKSSSNPAKVLMYLGLLGAATYAFVKYKNIQALKPIIQNSEKATKDGGRLTTQILKTKSRKANGDIVISGEKSIKTYFDKEGNKRAEIIHDMTKNERYSVYYDKEGNITKNVVSRMSVPTKTAKARLEQKMTNVYTRNNNGTVTTKTDVVDYQTKQPYTLYTYTRNEVIPNTSAASAAQTSN